MTESEIELSFAERLKSFGKKKLLIESVKFAFSETYPDIDDHPERSSFLHAELRELEMAGVLRFPSAGNKSAWLKETTPRLPAWIILLDSNSKAQRIDPAQIPWLAELSFCADLKSAVALEAAIAINKFLIKHRRNLIPVPMRERSLQIFGDEKKLQRFLSPAGLFGGRLSLASLGAFVVNPPLPHEKFPEARGKPVLVIENHHTYYSFCQWNRSSQVYSAIAYGSGMAFVRTDTAIDEIMASVEAGEIHYFGDIDWTGLEIPFLFNKWRSIQGLPPLTLASSLYLWLLANGVRQKVDEVALSSAEQISNWLPEQLRKTTVDFLLSGQRIPQESLGTDALSELGSRFFMQEKH